MTGTKTALLIGLACGLGLGLLWMQAASTESQDPFTLDVVDRAVFAPGLVDAEQAILDGLPGAALYRIDLDVPSSPRRIGVRERVEYTNAEDVALHEIYFHLHPNAAGGAIAFDELALDGTAIEPILAFDDHALRIPFDEPLIPGATTRIDMAFELTVPDGYMVWGPFGYVDQLLSLDQFYPVIPVYDDEGWNIGHAPTMGDWSYYDLSFYIVRIEAPASWTIAATGSEIDRKTSALRQSVTYAAGPVRDFYLAGGSRLEAVSATCGEVTVTHYVPNWGVGQAYEGLSLAREALEVFGRRFGPYPYTELDFVSTAMGGGGGMEYPGIIAMGHALYDPNAIVWGLPSIVMLASTVTHEMGHQWFYNAVGSDQIDEPWLDEGMAQYCVNAYYLDTQGEGSAASYRRSWEERMNRIDGAELPIGLPSMAYDPGAYTPIIYGRAPMFIHELESYLDIEFFLRAYYEQHKWGIATTESFLDLAQESSDQDLSELFDSWVLGDEVGPGTVLDTVP